MVQKSFLERCTQNSISVTNPTGFFEIERRLKDAMHE